MSSDFSSIQSQFNLNAAKSKFERSYSFENFRLDASRLMLYKDDAPLALAPKVVETLLALVERGDEIVSKEELIERLWKDSFVEESNLTQNIYLLRKTLGKTADGRDLIETFRRRGYRFNGEIKKDNGEDVKNYSITEFPADDENDPDEPQSIEPKKLITKRALIVLFSVILFSGLAGLSWVAVQRSNLFSTGHSSIRTLAVMPLVNESGNSNTEYLSDGITESLITNLSQLPDLSIKARSSVFRYKGKDVPLKTIGDDLSVQAILTGRVVERGSELIVNVELVETKTESVLWKADYNRSFANISTLQSEITRDIAEKLRIKLSGANEQKLVKNSPVGSETYQLYLKGRYHLNKIVPGDLNKAVGYFEQSIAQDSNFAPAYAGLADTYVALAGFHGKSVEPPREFWAQAKEAANKAVELDAQSAVSQIAYANVAYFLDYNLEEANRACQIALQLDPSSADAHALYAEILYLYERDEEATAEYRRALELDPLSMQNILKFGFFLINIKKDFEVEALMKKAMDLDPKLPTPHFVLWRLYMAKGMFARAVAEFTIVGDILGYSEITKVQREIFARDGWQAFLRFDTERLIEGQKTQYVRASDIALNYTQLGDKGKAFEYLEKAFYNRETTMSGMKRNRLLENLRDDPRFTDLVRRIESK